MEGENVVQEDGQEFEPVDVFQYNSETGVITQIEMIAVNDDPIITMLVHQANIDYAVLSVVFLMFLMYLVNWGARLWSK